MGTEEYLLKGPTFINLVKYMKKKRGQEGVDRVFQIVRKEHPDLFIAPEDMKPSKFYKEESFNVLLTIFDREYGKGDLKEAYNFGLFDSQNLGIMGFFISFLDDPTRIIKGADDSWLQYHNQGTLKVTEIREGLARIELRDYLQNRVICTELTGFFTGAGSKTKADDLRVEHTACFADGAPACEWTMTWKPKK